MTAKADSNSVLAVMRELAAQGKLDMSSSELVALIGASPATVKRRLESLVKAGKIMRSGQARATRYTLLAQATAVPAPPITVPFWSEASVSLRARLSLPLAARDAVTYQRVFVDRYVPNESTLLAPMLASDLAKDARMRGQQPAGTYARKVLEQLLIDLSWSSSRLEGNRYSVLATHELFKSGLSNGDADAVMLLNHKRAIEFLVDAVPEYGLTPTLIRNLHAVLLQDLLADSASLGIIRRKVVNISDTTYVPTQAPALLEEMFETIVAKARLIKNPVEAAFFIWVNLAYLQPFEDGNKRTSRLAANIPLMLYNCAPLSFNDVDAQDYALAMTGVYEFLDVSLAADLFAWTYRRSLQKYVVVLESMGAPDPVRLRYREALNDAIQRIVRERETLEAVLMSMGLAEESVSEFKRLLVDELQKLGVHNCARYRLSIGATEAWVAAGRPT
jgi:Fic family protein